MWRSHRIQTKQNSFDLFFLSAFFYSISYDFWPKNIYERTNTHIFYFQIYSSEKCIRIFCHFYFFTCLCILFVSGFAVFFFFILLSIIVLNFYRKSALQHNHRHIQTESKTTKSSSNAMNFENAHFNAFERYIDGLCDGGSAPQKYHQICTWCVVRFWTLYYTTFFCLLLLLLTVLMLFAALSTCIRLLQLLISTQPFFSSACVFLYVFRLVFGIVWCHRTTRIKYLYKRI